MKVRKEESPHDPGYPDAEEFLRKRAAFGVAILGAGLTLGACETHRTGGVPTRTGGVVMVPHSEETGGDSSESGTNIKTGASDDVPRLLGEPRVKPRDAHPPLPGVPPMMPTDSGD